MLAKLLAVAALAGSFLFARAGSLLAATSPEGRIRPLVGWLGTACGLLTELAIYAALAVSPACAPGTSPQAGVAGLDGTFGGALRQTFVASWGGPGTTGVWRLAIAALAVLGLRRMAELGYEHTARAPGNLFHRSLLRTLEQAVTFPAGERYAVIVLTAVFFGPRLTFLVLLGWGVLAAGYVLAGQVARSAGPARPAGPAAGPGGGLAAYRGDGVVSRWFGGLVQGRLPPLPPVLVGLFVTCVLAALGLGNLPGILVLTPVEAMMLAALGARHPHDGRLDWLVPALLMAGECVFLAALGLSYRAAAWLVFALLAAVLMRHVDLAFRARACRGLPADVFGLGWEGRMLLAGVAAVAGLVPFAYVLLSGYLWVLFSWDFLSGWLVPARPGIRRPGAHGRRRRLIGMVLAAGAGRRLRPDTDTLPKALLPVDGEVTILDIALRNLAAVGLRDIVIVVGYAAGAVRDRAAALERAHGVRLTLVDNDRAEDWNNAYSLWLAREHFAAGALLVNGDTVHPVSVEKTLLGQPSRPPPTDSRRRRTGNRHPHRGRRRQAARRRGDEGDHRLGRPPHPDHQADGSRAGVRRVHRRDAHRRGRRGAARGGPRGDLAPGSLAVLRGRLPGTRRPRRRDRHRAHRRGRMGGGRQPRRPAPGPPDRRPLLRLRPASFRPGGCSAFVTR